MEAPYSIASIPRPIDGVNGQVHAAPVYGVRESKKRKRHEVVVGVDGESVNIYNVKNMQKAYATITDDSIRSNLNESSHLTHYLLNPTYAVRHLRYIPEQRTTHRHEGERIVL